MSIDVALSTRRGVGRDTYSLPKKNAAAPLDHVNGHGPTKLRSRGHVNGHAPTKLRSRGHVYRFRFCSVDTPSLYSPSATARMLRIRPSYLARLTALPLNRRR